MPHVPCPGCLAIRRYRQTPCTACGCHLAYDGEHRSPVRRARFRVPPLMLFASMWLLLACGAGGDPARRARYDADQARCQKMTDSMAASARASGRDVDNEEFEPARVSCMTYRGWPEGRFN